MSSVTKTVGGLFGGSAGDVHKSQQLLLERQQKEARLAAQRAQANLNVDETAVVLDGAAADDAGGLDPRRKKGASSLSATLGLGGL